MGLHDRDYHRKRPDDDDDVVRSNSGDADTNDDDADEEDDSYDSDGHYGLHREGPDASDLRHQNEPALIPCPNCKRMIHEDSEWCHKCGHYVMDEELLASRPTWMWVGIAVALLIAAMWAIFG